MFCSDEIFFLIYRHFRIGKLCWFCCAAITKKLTKLTNKNKMEIVALWRKSIINHLHWVAASTPNGDGQTMLAKWLSLLNHIVNRHEMHGDLLFPTCLHGPLQDDSNKLWFTPGTMRLFVSNVLIYKYYLFGFCTTILLGYCVSSYIN